MSNWILRNVVDALYTTLKRKVKKRFVIHVKKGVSRENIEVAVHNDNIMLVGDGLRNTVITIARSVEGGYTTYSSATAGTGASTTNSVKWPGFHVIKNPTEASQFTDTRLLAGPTWLGSTTVPFTSGL